MNITENYIDMERLCNGDYISMALGGLLIISEVLGMIQKSECEKKDVVEDIAGNQIEIEQEQTFLQKTNGLFHLCYNLINKVKK